MISKVELIRSLYYFVLVVIGEVILHLSSSYFMMTNDYTFPAVVAVFLLIAWLLKANITTFIIVALLMAAYGSIAYITQFTVYTPHYPNTIQKFAPTILIKSLIYTFPILVVSVFASPKKRRN